MLPADLFEALRADFPTEDVFTGQQSSHGATGSRTGSGFDIYRGDGAYDALTSRSKAWGEFDAFINSERFADAFRSIFAGQIDDIGLRVTVAQSHVNPALFRTARNPSPKPPTFGDRVAQAANTVLDPFRKPKPVELFTRLDIHRSIGGYAKPPHCDRPNRLCSLIVYFTDAEKVGLEGGDLLIFKHNQPKPVEKYERHPRPENVTEIARLRPKANLGVFFPRQNNSYHGVTQVVTPGMARDFLYINISGRDSSLWY